MATRRLQSLGEYAFCKHRDSKTTPYLTSGKAAKMVSCSVRALPSPCVASRQPRDVQMLPQKQGAAMSDLTNAQYFAQRAIEARAMAKSATDPRAAEAQANLAKEYETLAKDFYTKCPSCQPPEDQAQARA